MLATDERLRRNSVIAILAVSALAAPSHGQEALSGGLGAVNVPVTFTTDNGWVYDGRIEIPAEKDRRPWAVMMLGGGLGTDIDWTVPGVMTLNGEDTRDGETIARALLDAGFVVMRWQAIRRGDPQHGEDPLMMDAPPVAQTIEQAKKALAAFRTKGVVPDDRIFLLGHSLGAWRASILAAEDIRPAGVVMLAGARLVRSDLDSLRGAVADAEAAFGEVDRNGDGAVSNEEWAKAEGTAKKLGIDSGFRIADVDGDGTVDLHEWSVAVVAARRGDWRAEDASSRDKYGHRSADGVIAERRIPTLLLVGALDERWRIESYAMTAIQRAADHPDYTWRVFENLGHQLGPQRDEPVEHEQHGIIAHARTGPISPEVERAVVRWLDGRSG